MPTFWLGKSCQFFWPTLGFIPRAANISHLAYQNVGKFFLPIFWLAKTLACQILGNKPIKPHRRLARSPDDQPNKGIDAFKFDHFHPIWSDKILLLQIE